MTLLNMYSELDEIIDSVDDLDTNADVRVLDRDSPVPKDLDSLQVVSGVEVVRRNGKIRAVLLRLE